MTFIDHKNTPLRVFEGFAGYGGASFGLKRSGINFEVIGMSEFDNFASQLLNANFPGIKNWGDITEINPKELPDFDFFTGGFPCQPFSSAGLQLGEADKYGRGTLFYHILRICSVKKPEYILLENVKGLTQKKFAATFKTIYCCPLKVSEQRDIHPQCCCNGIADDFSEGKPLS